MEKTCNNKMLEIKEMVVLRMQKQLFLKFRIYRMYNKGKTFSL